MEFTDYLKEKNVSLSRTQWRIAQWVDRREGTTKKGLVEILKAVEQKSLLERRVKNEITIKANVETTEIDASIEKVNRLNELLIESQALINSLGGKSVMKVNTNCNIDKIMPELAERIKKVINNL